MPHKNSEQHNANRRAKRKADMQDPAKAAERRARESASQKRYYEQNKEQILARNRIKARTRYASDPTAMREKSRAWKAKNQTVLLERQAAWRASNPKNVQAWNRKVKYGLVAAEAERMMEAQDRACAICREPFDESKPKSVHVDHCHSTGRVRAFLCNGCNNGLGRFRDSPDRLRAAIEYLARFA